MKKNGEPCVCIKQPSLPNQKQPVLKKFADGAHTNIYFRKTRFEEGTSYLSNKEHCQLGVYWVFSVLLWLFSILSSFDQV